MAKWNLVFDSSAEKDLKKIDKKLRKRIIEKLDWFSKNFDNLIPLSLTGEWRGFFKFRIGDWRAIYKVNWDKNQIIVYVIGHRKKIYKQKQSVT